MSRIKGEVIRVTSIGPAGEPGAQAPKKPLGFGQVINKVGLGLLLFSWIRKLYVV